MSMIGMAQTDVTYFLGIPVDGSKNEMIQKLKLKGFVINPHAEGVLTGKFNGADVSVHIVTNNNKVYRMQYTFPNGTISDAVISAPEPLGTVAIDSKFPLENYQIMKN